MPYSRDKTGIGMPLREKRARKRTNDTNRDKSPQVGGWRALNPECLSSNREPAFL